LVGASALDFSIYNRGMQPRGIVCDQIAVFARMKRFSSMGKILFPALFSFMSWAMAVCPVLSAQSVSENRVMQAASPPATVRVISQLVVLDVVVLDKGKKPVHSLQASDFHVLEDGKKQTVGSFEEHPAVENAGQANSGMAHEAAQGIFTNAAPTPFAGSSDSVFGCFPYRCAQYNGKRSGVRAFATDGVFEIARFREPGGRIRSA
jgi:hypothetical protein